ncbi:hypothetical protein ILUMI_08930 [Ignelater luminosus]|uniref:Uncharacterized protein n=1 Tax=Ignelater luminosus TaxID=2038154 RepID=A0A8K0D0S5_IGNLU|nr:hypothetical protein ILUMI_08930 [Ignelater luminosus]
MALLEVTSKVAYTAPADEKPKTRSMEFEIQIKNYPGTTTTEPTLLDAISDTLSGVYSKVKNYFKEEPKKPEPLKLVFPANLLSYSQLRNLPYLYQQNLGPSFYDSLTNQYLREVILQNKNIQPTNENKVARYFLNNHGQLVVKEIPAGRNDQGNSFTIDLKGVIQNSSALLGNPSFGSSDIGDHVQHLFHDIIAAQNSRNG